jgi:hypothetical protein
MNGLKTIAQAVPTFLPKLVPVGLLLLGLVLGFVWAYRISPSVYTAAEPVNLGKSWKEEWVKQAAWQYKASGDAENAKRQLSYLGNGKEILDGMLANPALASDPNLKQSLDALVVHAVNNDAQLAKIQPSFFNSDLTPFLCLFGLALLAGGFVIFNTLIPISLLFSGKTKEPGTVTSGQEAERRKAIAEAQKEKKTDFALVAPDRGKPVVQFMSSYLFNDDVYDDSFAIETSTGEFLGETGAGISKTLGVGKPKKVAAVEAWVFDKNDITTKTHVLVSDFAFHNDAIRGELGTKGELILAKPGAITLLETTTLTVQIRVVDMAYGSGAEGDNAYFEKIIIEIAAWPKKAAAPLPSGAPPPLPPADPYGGTGRFAPPPPAAGGFFPSGGGNPPPPPPPAGSL